jgi:hypothetical protein
LGTAACGVDLVEAFKDSPRAGFSEKIMGVVEIALAAPTGW